MRIDVLSVFPDFFQVLELSLVGKAQQRGLVSMRIHDVRDWTHDVHRTVDDTPFGGGAGMVMKADVWAEAIDDVVRQANAGRVVLAIPTPSGIPLTQRTLEDLADVDQIVIACGRYEGIDSRVAEYYRGPGRSVEDSGVTVEVMEYSLGDYVLNGGEVAAVALVEGVTRLIPGMVGNPESIVEESHGAAGLLEYPVYTRPTEFRGLRVPEILTSGNHGAIARWRRDKALERTAARRPDMVAKLRDLDKKDIAKLATLGWVRPAKTTQAVRPLIIRPATEADVVELTALAQRTFPDACPDYLTEADIAQHIARQLNEAEIRSWVAGPDTYLVLVAVVDGELIGYTMTALETTQHELDEGAPVHVAPASSLVYLSKCYVDRQWRGTGVYSQLMRSTIDTIQEQHPQKTHMWLGTNAANRRAINAYKKMGFAKSGKREFTVGGVINKDVTLARPLNLAE